MYNMTIGEIEEKLRFNRENIALIDSTTPTNIESIVIESHPCRKVVFKIDGEEDLQDQVEALENKIQELKDRIANALV